MIANRLALLFFMLWRRFFGSQIVPMVNIIYPVVQSVAMVLVLVLMNGSRRAGLSNPGAIFCIWSIFVICGVPEFYAWITIGSDPNLLTTLMIANRLALLFFMLWRRFFGSQIVPMVNIIYPVVQSVAMVLVLVLMNGSRRAGLSNPGAIFCIWSIFVICGVPEFYAWITIGSDPNYFLYTKGNPETSASFPNRQVLWWFSPLISKAYKNSLEIDSLFDLDEGLQSDNLQALWETEWNKSVTDYELRQRSQSSDKNFYTTESTPLIFEIGKTYGTNQKTMFTDRGLRLFAVVS
ncbi:hypothetical protein NECAME_04295 [Necator americanus]|uniref:Uncharacterized protein n=1 Tax=Necator americanus TaxID=51031 RepID=W2SV38_NECAM|nr:hypothetical protein NECAME_04295 [Necator americanus]ETN73609.1 hypothetical protein NECAME_04295 [Necator americanus]